MLTRDEAFRKFGPILLESLCLIMLDYQNEVRAKLSMPLLTMDDVLLKLENFLSNLTPYDWTEQ